MRHFLTLGAILVAAVGCGGATGTGNGLFGASASGGTSSGGASGASGAGASGGGASGMAGASGGGTSGAAGASGGGTSGAAAASGSGGCSGVFNCPLLMACPPGEEPVTPAGQCCPTSCGPSGAGGSTTGAECTSGADCPVPAVCKLCADGSTSCAHADCVNGKCSTTFPPCPVDAGSGTCDPLFCPSSGGATPCCVGMACGLNYGAGCVSGAKVCTNDSQCPKSLAPCRLCPDGTAACPWSKCVSGQCTSGITTCGTAGSGGTSGSGGASDSGGTSASGGVTASGGTKASGGTSATDAGSSPSCAPSGGCAAGPRCGDACCAAKEWCDTSGSAPKCRCGTQLACAAGSSCVSNLGNAQCGFACCPTLCPP